MPNKIILNPFHGFPFRHRIRRATAASLPWILPLVFLQMAGAADVYKSSGEAVLPWSAVRDAVLQSSKLIRAASYEYQAAEQQAARGGRHWLPRLYLTGKAFSTNDPGATFMYRLLQREVGASDFAPSALNRPGDSFFQQGTLGVDLPLFQGGMAWSEARAAEKNREAKFWERRAQQSQDYARAAVSYGQFMVYQSQRESLQALAQQVQKVLDRYRIGSKANPVGYSGLLGLKTLRNRIQALLLEAEARSMAVRGEIRSLAPDLPSDWMPQQMTLNDLTEKVWRMRMDGASGEADNSVIPASIESIQFMAESLEDGSGAARALWFPRLGVFAQGDLYRGDRATATSYTTGAYLQWDLFSSHHLGTYAEAQNRALAMAARADQAKLDVVTRRGTVEESLRNLERNLVLVEESHLLLDEQTKTAQGLFLQGVISALQLVEVLNRRADLLAQRAEVQVSYIKAKSDLFLLKSRNLEDEFQLNLNTEK